MRIHPIASIIGTVLFVAHALTFSVIARASEFDEIYEREGIGFRVQSANDSSLNRLTISPDGLIEDNTPVVTNVDGIVTGGEIADLDSDGSPEMYVFVHSAGSGAYGSLAAYAVNNRRSLSPIHLPPLTDNPELAASYMGHDQFSIDGDSFVRRIPRYLEGDTNSEPSGGHHQLRYGLRRGEAGWILHLEHVETIEPE